MFIIPVQFVPHARIHRYDVTNCTFEGLLVCFRRAPSCWELCHKRTTGHSCRLPWFVVFVVFLWSLFVVFVVCCVCCVVFVVLLCLLFVVFCLIYLWYLFFFVLFGFFVFLFVVWLCFCFMKWDIY